MANNPFDALAALRATLQPDSSEAKAETTANTAIPAPQPTAAHGVCRLFYERKGRGGREATIVECPDTMTDADVSALASRLKRKLAVGGSARGGEILLQGDRRDQLRPLLKSEGFTVKG